MSPARIRFTSSASQLSVVVIFAGLSQRSSFCTNIRSGTLNFEASKGKKIQVLTKEENHDACKLSSTRKEGSSSYGDGSFVRKSNNTSMWDEEICVPTSKTHEEGHSCSRSHSLLYKSFHLYIQLLDLNRYDYHTRSYSCIDTNILFVCEILQYYNHVIISVNQKRIHT